MSSSEIEARLRELDDQIAALRPLAADNAAVQKLLADLQTQRVELSGTGNVAVSGDDNITAAQRSIAVRENSGQIALIVNEYHGQDDVDDATLRAQIGEYLRWLGDQCGVIELRGIYTRERVKPLDLETAYVPLALEVTPEKPERPDRERAVAEGALEAAGLREIASNELLKHGERLIMTGGPGSGKTTVLAHIAWIVARALAEDAPELAERVLGLTAAQGGLPLPMLIPLSAYAEYRRDRKSRRDLAAFISHYLREQEAVFDLPADFFQRLWRGGRRVMLLLDGLDEVPNEGERQQVSRAIEKVVSGRDALRVVVTCRSAAYQGKTPLGKGFRRIDVRPLSPDQVSAMVTQAYTALYRDEVLRRARINALLNGIERMEAERHKRQGTDTPRLVASPLLVRMLLVVHYSERRLPEQRAEFYTKTIDAMLAPDEYSLDVEVGQRLGRLVGGDVKLHRELLQYIAWELHRRGRTQGRDIDERRLKALLQAHPTHARLADAFIEITRTRSPLLEERAGRYRFLHLGFQEFLVARHLATTVMAEAGLKGVVERVLADGRVGESWWREPLLLLAGYLNAEGTPDLATQYVTLLTRATGDAATRLAAAEVAGSAVLEWRTEQVALQAQVAERLAAQLMDAPAQAKTPAATRVQAGATLARLDDPRPEALNVDALQFCRVPAGPFRLGADDIDEDSRPPHEVDIPYAFGMGRWPVTQAQFAAFVDAGGYLNGAWWPEARAAEFWRADFGFKGRFDSAWRSAPLSFGDSFSLANHPVVGVSWYEALAFTRWLTARWRGHGALPQTWAVVLPSEAEWEKAARGGLHLPPVAWTGNAAALVQQRDPASRRNRLPQRRYPWGNRAISNDVANWKEWVGATNAVGCFASGSSPYGCEEMSGGVWEWTRSLWLPYGDGYVADDGREALDAGPGTWRVVRGGSWATKSADSSRCGFRSRDLSHNGLGDYGFRVAVSPLISAL